MSVKHSAWLMVQGKKMLAIIFSVIIIYYVSVHIHIHPQTQFFYKMHIQRMMATIRQNCEGLDPPSALAVSLRKCILYLFPPNVQCPASHLAFPARPPFK